MTGVGRLNEASPRDAARLLATCCAAPQWVDAMVASRPYPDAAQLTAIGSGELDRLDWPQVLIALEAHPRIGDRVTGSGTEAAWSRREQAGMATATDDVRAALVEANRAYEERFGHVFLIFATGSTDAEMLAAALERLSNSDETERAVVRDELAKIVSLRLERMAQA